VPGRAGLRPSTEKNRQKKKITASKANEKKQSKTLNRDKNLTVRGWSGGKAVAPERRREEGAVRTKKKESKGKGTSSDTFIKEVFTRKKLKGPTREGHPRRGLEELIGPEGRSRAKKSNLQHSGRSRN